MWMYAHFTRNVIFRFFLSRSEMCEPVIVLLVQHYIDISINLRDRKTNFVQAVVSMHVFSLNYHIMQEHCMESAFMSQLSFL